ncbi:integrin alpha [Wenzhouxiangella sp. XN201]|uniref:integrin alpha n=1 Tax=Wenzhouxiangella sp. XN201 TaxID=2710755 RepID=UPI0013DBD1E0
MFSIGLLRTCLATTASCVLFLGLSPAVLAEVFPPHFYIGGVDGSNGFQLIGENEGDRSGYSVSRAGDVNGDGRGDVIIGAFLADVDGHSTAGRVYVVFGGDGSFPDTLELDALDGFNGFRLEGVAVGDHAGNSVSAAGDVNGDGFDDLIVGANLADPNGKSRAGSSYVVFGRDSGFPATFSLDSLDGASGFRLDGEAPLDGSGGSVSAAGDINGDGIDDLIIGAHGADHNGDGSGSSYVVFGRTAFAAVEALGNLNGTNGFRVDGAAAGDRSGKSVSAAGDVNGDGIDDLIIGAFRAAPNGKADAGSAFLVFGRETPFPATLNLGDLDGTDGFRIDGVATGDFTGNSVSGAGDVNGDGIDEVIIGADRSDPGGLEDAGSAYVVFGREGSFPATILLSGLNGLNGFRLAGMAAGDRTGNSVSAAGDVNDDGVDDLIVGAFDADDPSISATDCGLSYLVFGHRNEFPASVDLGTLDGKNGLRLIGGYPGDFSGRSVSGAGDVNNDGIDDIIIGADLFELDDWIASDIGSSYVVFGRSDKLFTDRFESK